MGRLKLLAGVCLRILRDGDFAGQVKELQEHGGGLKPQVEALQAERKRLLAELDKQRHSMAQGAQVLAILQREGRFIDFLLEPLDAYSDAQVGAVVRSVHEGCRRALDEYFTLEPVRSEQEGTQVEVAADFDPSALRLTGEPPDVPPYRGTLKHHGWRVSKHNLPALPEGQDPHIVQPAEVEV